MAVMRLLSGERGYASLDPPDVQEALAREAKESNPDTGLFRQFPQALLSLHRIAAGPCWPADRAHPARPALGPLAPLQPPLAGAGDTRRSRPPQLARPRPLP